MDDIVFVLIGLAFFALAIAYAHACDGALGGDS